MDRFPFEIVGDRFRQFVKSDNPRKFCHVYQIRNIINNKVYIGGCMKLLDRWSQHIKQLREGWHHAKKLQEDFNLYGECSFAFEILEPIWDRRLLRSAEQDYIDFNDSFNNGYNSCPLSTSPKGFKQTKESKIKISIAKKGKNFRFGYSPSESTRQKLREANLGKKLPEDVKAKLRGRKFNLTEQAKQNISDSSGKKNFYEILFEDGSIKRINFFRKYCIDNNINYKLLHAWSIKRRDGMCVHPLFRIKILSLTVINQ